MTQKKLIDYKDEVKPEWAIKQLKDIGMTYTEMADRMGVNKSTLYRFRKGTHRSPKMKEKILKMFNNPYYGVVIFHCEGYGSPHLRGEVYPEVYNEADLQKQINFDKKGGRTVIYSKFVKRFTSAMILRHWEEALNMMEIYDLDFKNKNQWILEQVMLMKTQKTRDKTLKILPIDYKEI